MERKRIPTLVGAAEMTSPWFSNRWVLSQGDRVLANVRRLGRIYVSAADLGDAGRLIIEPCGQGTVRAADAADEEIARIERQSWLGRRWEISGFGFRYELVSDPRPRKWHIGVSNAPIADITGSLLSYNHVAIECGLALPVPAVLLAWHVVARPWEAAAEPRGLVPIATSRAS